MISGTHFSISYSIRVSSVAGYFYIISNRKLFNVFNNSSTELFNNQYTNTVPYRIAMASVKQKLASALDFDKTVVIKQNGNLNGFGFVS